MKKTKKKAPIKNKARFAKRREDEVPFVPDYELLERMRNKPSAAEVSAIGLMLLSSLPPLTVTNNTLTNTVWSIHGKLESMRARL